MDTRPRPLPYRRALDELVAELIPGARVVRARRLRGGIGTLMHLVEVDDGGERRRLTLRRLNQPQWGMDTELARKEWDVLARLRGTDVAAPEPIWLETTGERFGVPTMLLDHLPGRPVLAPDDPAVWADGIASALASIHAVEVDRIADVLPAESREERMLRHLAEELTDAETTGAAIDVATVVGIVLDRLPGVQTRRRLTHGDFHAGNVLWSDGTVSGVLDWPAARIGDPRADLAYLRLDTTLILGEDAAEAVLAAYERTTGAPVDDIALWDLLAVTTALPEPVRWLPGWLDLGRVDLDEDTIRRRFERFVAEALRRV